MPLHQISVIPRDVTSSRVSGSGKAKDKDKQVCDEFTGRIRSRALTAGDTADGFGSKCSSFSSRAALQSNTYLSKWSFTVKTEKVL